MNNRSLIAIAFLTGLSGGWYGKTWLESYQVGNKRIVVSATGNNQSASPFTNRDENREGDAVPTDARQITQPALNQSNQTNPLLLNTPDNSLQPPRQSVEVDSTGISIIGTFETLLRDRRYFSAMTLYQEQEQQNKNIVAQLKKSLVNELKVLTKVRNTSDFSELIDNYLSIYYDDIDVLLLLVEFNQMNGSYLEVVNVFLLAKTYAYSEFDKQKVTSRFNKFVMNVDSSYTRDKDWWSLINLYTHIDASGLMTSTYQYQQALAHLRSGDESFAIEKFNQLLDDSLVGESAATALSSLSSDTETPTIVYKSAWEGADSITLQKLGNQYAVNLDNSRRDSVKLLIDTGASMTAVSRDSFNTLNANGDAVEQERRVFRTASGLVQAAVFSIPELRLGPHQLKNTQVAVIDFDSSRGVDGLLGMNILGQFRFQIDQDTSNLLLSKK